jgi:rubrerythrin
VCEQMTPPPDSVDALSDITLQGELNDLIRRRIERETVSLRTFIMRLQQSRSRLEEQHSARETQLLSQLDDAQKHIARLQAVPFPLSLMHCNKCGEPFSENEAIHVADNCGAVSGSVRSFFEAC